MKSKQLRYSNNEIMDMYIRELCRKRKLHKHKVNFMNLPFFFKWNSCSYSETLTVLLNCTFITHTCKLHTYITSNQSNMPTYLPLKIIQIQVDCARTDFSFSFALSSSFYLFIVFSTEKISFRLFLTVACYTYISDNVTGKSCKYLFQKDVIPRQLD